VWAAMQLLLVVVACIDIATRRVPNRMVLPLAVGVLVLRGVFSLSSLAECAVAAACAFALFLLIAVVTDGGLGMGDVKLAGLIGLLLGPASLPALLIGALGGGVASAVVLASGRGRGHTIAYAPYLCFGAAVAVLSFAPPPLV
jgi:leader peptidase (prepilin peptidase) / N-methyltransferase